MSSDTNLDLEVAEEAEGNAGDARPPGRLSVSAPHWTAEVRVYNNNYRQVAYGVGELRDIELSPGIYGVEIDVPGAEKPQSEWVAVHPGAAVRVEGGDWKLKPKLASAAPLYDTDTTREWHTGPAEQWSRQVTWQFPQVGATTDSHLFIFVRTLKPEKHKSFDEGLHLLDANGALVTDFSDSAQRDKDRGWMAFHADIPAGYYILKRARQGVQLRFQPIYLCPGWETQVYIAAKNNPSLRTITMNMVRHGTGFQPGDETALAAQVALDSLMGSSGAALVTSDKIAPLLGGKYENPWLGILAAYNLQRSQETSRPSQRSGGGASNEQTAALLERILAFLKDTIGEHPDVRALHLIENEPPDRPFPQPPLLRVGLMRVQDNSLEFTETIPTGSLTDLVLDSLVVNSPWTAWRRLERLPEQDDYPRLDPSELALRRTSPGDEAVPTAGQVTTLQSAQLAQVSQMAQRMVQSEGLGALMGKLTFDAASLARTLLGGVNPKAVSQASSIPLARVEDSLKRLESRAERSSTPVPSSRYGRARRKNRLTMTEQVVLDYALQEDWKRETALAKGMGAIGGGASSDSSLSDEMESDESREADAVEIETRPTNTLTPTSTSPQAPTLTKAIAATVGKIRTELDRISYKIEGSAKDESRSQASLDRAREIVGSLRALEEGLLQRSIITVVTSPDGEILQPDDLFNLLVALPQAEADSQPKPEVEFQAWAKTFADAAAKSSVVRDPTRANVEWNVQRTPIEFSGEADTRAYLNVLHHKDQPALDQATLDALQPHLSSLARHAALFAYGTGSEWDKRVEKLVGIVEELAQAASLPLPTP